MDKNIGRYEVERVLGKGAMGNVYLAFDPVIERHVAIKTIRLDHLETESDRTEFTRRFFQEARIGGRLHHPGVVTIHDLGSHEGEPFLVMEYVDGQDLSRRLREKPQLERAQVIEIIEMMADTLDAAHSHKIIHRDIKPQNIMLPVGGGIKILDFGIAKQAGMDMTLNGAYWGTPAYSAPEQITERKVDHRADLYAFGLVVHKLLTLQDAFFADNVKKLFYQILYDQPRLSKPLKHLDLPLVPLHQILSRALNKDPDRRYQRASFFKEELLALFHRSPNPNQALRTEEPIQIVQEELHPELHSSDIPTGGFETQTFTAAEVQASTSQRFDRLRERFHESLGQGNLAACKLLLRTMERKNWPIDEERRLLDEASRTNQTQVNSEKDREVLDRRDRFHQHLETGYLEAAESELVRLRELTEAVQGEESLLAQRQQDRITSIILEQVQFNEAIAQGKLGRARASFRALKKLGSDLNLAERQLRSLEESLRVKTGERLDEIGAARSRFKSALVFEDLEEAEAAFLVLKGRGLELSRELSELEGLAGLWASKNPDEVTAVRQRLAASLKSGDLNAAEHHLFRLNIAADPKDSSKLAKWNSDLKKARAAKVEGLCVNLEDQMEAALAHGDLLHVGEFQRQLEALGADSPRFQWLVRKVSGEDPGPRPLRPLKAWWWALGFGGLACLSWAVWFFMAG